MAPPEAVVEWQTSEILKYLLDDEEHVNCHQLTVDDLETDGPTEQDSFDPVLIADKLRTCADEMNDDITFRAALDELKKAVAQEAAEAAFSRGVDALCRTRVSQGVEVAPEMQLIRASASLGLYIVKSSPDLKNKVQRAMNAFLNRNVRTWVSQQGGWDNVNI